MKLTIISASIRHGRQTHFVAEEMERRLNTQDGIEASIVDLADYAFPLFQDTHKADAPLKGADELRNSLQQADGLFFVSPEYNGSYTSALKNMTDHFSKAEFSKKAIGVVSVSSGAIGGMRGALQMQQLVLALFGYPIPQMMLVSEVQHLFDEKGHLVDETFGGKLEKYLKEYLWFASAVYEKKMIESRA